MKQITNKTQFDFGENWVQFTERALTREKVKQAKNDFIRLTSGINLDNIYFLDVGFGQGLSLLIAKQLGCKVLGCEINPKCIISLNKTMMHFPSIKTKEIPIVLGSILEKRILTKLKKRSEQGYGIVHSWGVLHHTGNMKLAIENVSSLVQKNGYLILAIYNKHWSSPMWKIIKKIYGGSPFVIKKTIIYLLYPFILVAKIIVLRKNPFEKNRGMDFYYDTIDWIGGYPYEYASVEEISNLVNTFGFKLIRIIHTQVPTGCNQYVFQKGNT